MDYLEQNNDTVLTLPSKSQSINYIQHIWEQLDERLRQRQSPPRILYQLLYILRAIQSNKLEHL